MCDPIDLQPVVGAVVAEPTPLCVTTGREPGSWPISMSSCTGPSAVLGRAGLTGLAEIRHEYDDVDGEAWEERRIEPEGFLDADDD